MNYLVYFCIFGNKDYLNLVHLLAVSIKLFGIPNENIHFLAITNNDFIDELNNTFNKLNLNFNIFLIDNNNFEYNLSSRLIIFNYENINNYNKILYIDTDILITNNLNNLFNEPLEDKLYVLSEGVISDPYHGVEFFDFSKINKLTKGFTSGLLLFNNCITIKNLFINIMENIQNNLKNNGIKPIAYDQSFINYYTIVNNLHNNNLMIGYAINNPIDFNFKLHTISHFPGGVGNYEYKYNRMIKYLLYLFDLYPNKSSNDNYYINKKFNWLHDCININGYIHFLESSILETSWGNGVYTILNNFSIKAQWCDDCHILIFNNDRKNFVSIRRKDNYISKGFIVE
jgi:hypothetical protein